MQLDEAKEAGLQAASSCAAKAEKLTEDFMSRASLAFVSHLAVHGRATGEQLTDAAKACGIRAHDDRAFGAVTSLLARRGKIMPVATAKRAKGHGSAGATVWALSTVITKGSFYRLASGRLVKVVNADDFGVVHFKYQGGGDDVGCMTKKTFISSIVAASGSGRLVTAF